LIRGKITVVMPAYNEARHIIANLLETVNTLSAFEYDFEVIVVDDGSPDKTFLHAARLLSTHPETIRVVHYDANHGKGNALMCGATFARGDYIVFMDADMDLHPSQLPLFFGIMEATDADVVIGSKRHPLSNVKYPRRRRLYSWAYYNFVKLLFGLPVKDTQTGLKVFKRQVIDSVFSRVLAKRFAFDLEVLANAHHRGFKIESAPVTLEFQRVAGRIHWGDIFRIFVDTLAIFYRLRILRYYDRPGVPESIQMLSSIARELRPEHVRLDGLPGYPSAPLSDGLAS
jgi:glycosyltransferase involved in cell wall biosynthesis